MMRHATHKVGPLLWEVICCTLLTNPAEQSVVEQVIGESLIQESSFLHREALALRDIFFAAAARNHGSHEHHGNVTKTPSYSDLEKSPTVCANPPSHLCRRLNRKDGCQPPPSTNLSHKTEVHLNGQMQSRIIVGGSNRLKSSDVDADVPLSQSKAKKGNGGMCKLDKAKKIVTGGDGIYRLFKQGDALQPLPQRSMSSLSSDETLTAIKNRSSSPSHCGQNVDHCADDILPLDFSSFLHERGAKINAYDIDEVAPELRDAFANERVYLNQLVEQLRRALDECIDSYSMVNNKPKFDDSKKIKDRMRVANVVEISKTVKSSLLIRSSKHIGQVAQKSPSSSPQAAILSKPSLVPVVKSTKLVALPKATLTTIKPTKRPPLMNVVATNKSVRERRGPMS